MRLGSFVLVACAITAFATVPAGAQSRVGTALAVASDLGVGLDELVACSTDARSRAEGERGSPERRVAIQAMVLSCLQQTRPDLTAEKFDAVIAAHRSAGAD